MVCLPSESYFSVAANVDMIFLAAKCLPTMTGQILLIRSLHSFQPASMSNDLEHRCISHSHLDDNRSHSSRVIDTRDSAAGALDPSRGIARMWLLGRCCGEDGGSRFAVSELSLHHKLCEFLRLHLSTLLATDLPLMLQVRRKWVMSQASPK